MSKHDEHVQMLKDCEDREEKLTDWERSFISSLTEWVDKGHTLTDKQAKRLDEIWERIT